MKILYENRTEYDILMNVPEIVRWEEMMKKSKDRYERKLRVRAIKDTVNIYAIKEDNNKTERKEKVYKEKIIVIGSGVDTVKVREGGGNNRE